MTNRIASILLLLFLALNVSAQSPKPGDRPNIIFILTDDQRWDALGYARNKLVTTPEMDKLAKEGVYFENGLVTTPICAASRASIFSGLYERTHAYNFQTGAMKEEYMQLAYPRLLKESGYTTAFYGKFGVNYEDKDKLFDVYESYDRANQYKDKRGYFYKMLGADTVHLSRYTGQKAIDFIEQANSDKPFCLSLSFSFVCFEMQKQTLLLCIVKNPLPLRKFRYVQSCFVKHVFPSLLILLIACIFFIFRCRYFQ